jgi:tryptophanyl-tRNA synthetase
MIPASFIQRTFSGIQPTGSLHLGNYFGAVKRWKDSVDSAGAAGQQPHQQIFSIVDLHAITLPQEAASLNKNIMDMAASLLAIGLDPDKCVLFQQSRVAEHAELAWILGCHCTLPQLARLPQYREKSAKLKENPLGLLVYPVLQSADILLYKACNNAVLCLHY